MIVRPSTLLLLAAGACSDGPLPSDDVDTEVAPVDSDSDAPPDTDVPPVPAVCDVRGNVCVVAGVPGTLGFNGDGVATEAWLYFPSSLAWSTDGHVLIDDFNNNRIRRLESDGTLLTVAGAGIHGWADPTLAPLETPLENPIDLAVDAAGRLYLAELHTGRIVAIDAAIAIIAGTGEEGLDPGDGGPALSGTLLDPQGVDIAPDGTVYIADTGRHAIRSVDPDGVLHLVAGDGEPGIDDGAGGARFRTPQRVRIDGDRLLVADTGNHLVRAVDRATGAVTVVAGTGAAEAGAPGGQATATALKVPGSVRGLGDGGFLIADTGNHRVLRVRPDGTVDLIAGTGTAGATGDGGPAVDATFNLPTDVIADDAGNVYVADLGNGTVRRIAAALPERAP